MISEMYSAMGKEQVHPGETTLSKCIERSSLYIMKSLTNSLVLRSTSYARIPGFRV